MSDTSRHARFYDTVTFLVEDCLFKVPRDPFQSESIAFRDMFLLPTEEHHEEGNSDENPIRLEGIPKDEFEQLLNVLFFRPHGARRMPTTIAEWTSVLKLAGLWGFDAISHIAMNHLRNRLSVVEKIVLGMTYDLDFGSWMLPAMHEIVRRHEPISVEEAQQMGLEMSIKLASVREQIAFQPSRRYDSPANKWEAAPGRRPNVEILDFTHILRETFERPSK